MRTIHTDLIVAQQSGLYDPYIYLEIGEVNYFSRLLSLEHREEPYGESAVIVLTNHDRYFDNIDIRGKAFTIGYGFNTATGNRYCGDGNGSDATPTLFVKSQSIVSMQGRMVCILYCEGGWSKLGEANLSITASAPYFNASFVSNQTVYQLIEDVLAEVIFTLNALGTQDDNIINSFQPEFTINPLSYETAAGIIYRLIQMTKCYLRQVETRAFEVVFPQSSDAVNETYYSHQEPYFKEYAEKSNLVVPNSIYVFCNKDPDTNEWNTANYPLITGTATDSASIASYTTIENYYIEPTIRNQTDANNRAAAILARIKAETLSGRLLLPFHDCRVEMFDRVQIQDWRGLGI